MSRPWPLCLLLLLLPFTEARAQDEWVPGTITSQWGVNCAIVGQTRGEVMLQSASSWLRRVDLSAPQTGDVSYVSLVMSVPGLNCDANSAVAVEPELHLPPGATLAISANTPVRCYHRVGNGTGTPTAFSGTQLGITGAGNVRVGPRCPDGLGGGLGTPFQVGALQGSQGGRSLGPQVLVRSTLLEVQVPLRFARALNPAVDRVRFSTTGLTPLGTGWNSSTGMLTGSATANPDVGIGVPYRPLFNSLVAGGISAGGANVSGAVSHFFTAGTVFVDHGPTAAYGNSINAGSVPATAEAATASVPLTGLPAASTVHWRLRLVTALGTFISADQVFSTTPAAAVPLTVARAGSGSGTVTSTPAGISCGAVCSAGFAAGTAVNLAASPAAGSVFAGWGGACSGLGACVVTLSAARTVSATFAPAPTSFPLDVTVFGTGTGSVGSQPAGVNCGTTCTAQFPTGSRVTLTALPSAQSAFLRWSGPCAGIIGGPVCTVTMDQARSVGAQFGTALSFGSLVLETQGLPAGAVASLRIEGPGGLEMRRALPAGVGQSLSDLVVGSYTMAAASVVFGGTTYNPSPALQSFTLGPGTTAARVLFAPAAAGSQALNVALAGAGSGSVTSTPAGITCGTACSATLASGAHVILDASAAAGSAFSGWTGHCQGTASCRVTMSAARSVTAHFGQAAPSMAVARSANSPADALQFKGQANVPVVAFTINPSQATLLQQVVLQSGGTGRDELDLLAVRLYADTNGNGLIDAGEPQLASGRPTVDDGAVTLQLSTPRQLNPGVQSFVAALDLNTTIAAAPRPTDTWLAGASPHVAWALVPLMPLMPLPLLALCLRQRRRLRWGVLLLALATSACNLGPNVLVLTRTYQLTLTAVGASGMPVVTGLPLAGATIRVVP
jgi:hypothetical protein